MVAIRASSWSSLGQALCPKLKPTQVIDCLGTSPGQLRDRLCKLLLISIARASHTEVSRGEALSNESVLNL